MANLLLNRLPYPTVAPCPRRLCRQMSESQQRPVMAPDACLGSRLSAAGRGVKFIFAEIRTLNHDAKIMHEAKLRHASTQFASRKALTAIQIRQTTTIK